MAIEEDFSKKADRFIIGTVLLFFVDIIWLSSFEGSKILNDHNVFNKPFFTSYVKTSLSAVYLFGICLWPPWRDSYCRNQKRRIDLEDQDGGLSDPQYVPVKRCDKSSGTESDDSSRHSVRFSRVVEVRHMSQVDASDALFARLSYGASLRPSEPHWPFDDSLPLLIISKIALIYSILWFFGNYTFDLSLAANKFCMSRLVSSSCPLFTLLLSSLFPSGAVDRFSASKLLAVFTSMGGLAVICYFDFDRTETGSLPAVLFSLISALCFSCYLVFIRRILVSDRSIVIPLYLGFVGLFTLITLWPLFIVLHYYQIETFVWPSQHEWLVILMSGIATNVSHFLWLWGSLVTSSLLAAMAPLLIIPMETVADILWLQSRPHAGATYFGLAICFLAFSLCTLVTYYESEGSWSPSMFHFLSTCKRAKLTRVPEHGEQTEALIAEDSEKEDDPNDSET